jgi:ribosome-binding factor A
MLIFRTRRKVDCDNARIASAVFVAALSSSFLALLSTPTFAFVIVNSASSARTVSLGSGIVEFSKASSTELSALYSPGRAASRGGQHDSKSKRQYRVGQLVQTELANILHSGVIKGDATDLDEDLRRRISIVTVDVAPDLRQARVSVSIRSKRNRKENDGGEDDDDDDSYSDSNPALDKRRAYSWLVTNMKPLRHTLAQRMSHMKTSPSLTFVQVDVSAAVDVMYLIDKVSKGYERPIIGEFGGDDDDFPNGFAPDDDGSFDDDGEWDEEDDDFFRSD